jgi:hypothetical protein
LEALRATEHPVQVSRLNPRALPVAVTPKVCQ